MWSENKTIEASLLSIDFINYMKKGKMQSAIDLLTKPPLARPNESFIERTQNYLNETLYCN